MALSTNTNAIFALTETWLTDDFSSNSLNLSNTHDIFRVDRVSSRGGGVLIAVPVSLKAALCHNFSFSTPNFDVVTVILPSYSGNTYIACIYRKPNYAIHDDFTKLFADLSEKSQSIILGDFNFPNFNWGSPFLANSQSITNLNYSKIINVCLTNGLSQLVKEPSRLNNFLDLVFSNVCHDITDVSIIDPFGDINLSSDHMGVCFQYKVRITKSVQNRPIRLNFRKADDAAICEYLSNIDWEFLFSSCVNSSDMYQLFLHHVHFVFDNFIPSEKIKPTVFKLSKKTKKFYGISKRLKLKSFKTGCTLSKTLSKKFSNVYKKSRRSDIENWESRHLNNVHHSSFWKYVNNKIDLKQKSSVLTILGNNGLPLTGTDLCNAMSAQFTSTFNHNSTFDFSEIQLDAQVTPLRIVDFDLYSVLGAISKLKGTFGSGGSKIPNFFLKKYSHFLAYPLAKIYNVSFLTASLPSIWKNADIIPIGKISTPTSVEHLRPISITCVEVKIMESIVCDSMLTHIFTNKLISEFQFGFLRGRSVESQLIYYSNFLAESLDDSIPVDVFYLDFKKAFDKIPHSILLSKLSSYGFKGPLLKFIQSWLSGRFQRVCYNNEYSDYSPVISGVPQGTVLGPLLFNIFINDIFKCVNSVMLLYADDGKIMRPIKNYNDHLALKQDITSIVQWCVSNGMELSLGKCAIMHFGANNPNYVYDFNSTTINAPSTIRDLGITFDSQLSFKPHIQTIVNNCHKRCNRILSAFRFKPPSLKLKLFKTFVLPILQYCSSVWYPKTKELSKLIESVQRRFTRYLLTSPNKPAPTYKERLIELDIPSLSYRLLKHDLTLMYCILTKKIFYPDCLHLFTLCNSNHHNRGHKLKLFFKRANTDILRKTFAFRNLARWNSLHSLTIESKFKSSFLMRLNHDIKHAFFDATD